MQPFKQEIAALECQIIQELSETPHLLSKSEESLVRWAMSLARLTNVEGVAVDSAMHTYRRKLHKLISPSVSPDGVVALRELADVQTELLKLVINERRELLELYRDQLSENALDNAVRSRPLALALSGGGGTSYVFLGAFSALEEAGIRPAAITGSSMGAILGAYRATKLDYELDGVKELASHLQPRAMLKALQGFSRFSIPATLTLSLNNHIGFAFKNGDKLMRIKDLAIPFCATVSGLTQVDSVEEAELDKYGHLLDDATRQLSTLKKEEKSIVWAITQFARRPLKALYLGEDALSQELHVLDAVGFSSTVPGAFQYDIASDDEASIQLMTQIMQKAGVTRLLDGGFVDNLPVGQALSMIQNGVADGRDPFVLALDGFAPNLSRHWLFLPLMQLAYENSREGRALAHRTISFRHVLSPVNVMPKIEALMHAIANGYHETLPHMAFIQKMVGPIPMPSELLSVS